MKRSRRSLTPEERDLWKVVARTVRARAQAAPDGIDPADPAPVADRTNAAVPSPQRVSVQKAKLPVVPAQPDPKESARTAASLRMDRKTFDRMTRGKLSPQATLDLHGMTLSQAHGEVTRFVLGARALGLRLVLVITGKGSRDETSGELPGRAGVLRYQVPQWLALPPLRDAVLQVTTANVRHGGGGAIYVYLRR